MVTDGVQGAVQVVTGLIMYRQDVGTGLLEIFNIACRVHNHQVDIQRFARMLFDMLDNGLSKRDVGYKQPVHHVHMQPVTLRLVQHLYITLKVAKVGRK